MSSTDFAILRSGFDTLELAYRMEIPVALHYRLEEAKLEAQQSRKDEPVTFRTESFLVSANGGQGGYAFQISTGKFGLIVKLRDRDSNDPWKAHVKFRAHGLAYKGLIAAKEECDTFLRSLGCRFDPNDARVSRIDFAIDVHFPDLVLNAFEFVTHARTNKNEYIDRNSTGDICNYLRIGKMPNKQLCVYEKSKKIISDRDLIWLDIFEKALLAKELNIENKKIWRFEFRAGRNYINQFIRPRRWDKFLNNWQTIFLKLSNSITLRTPILDHNRSRWPFHPLWPLIQSEIRNYELKFEKKEIPYTILKAIEDEIKEGLDKQVEGLIITRNAIDSSDLKKFLWNSPQYIQDRLDAIIRNPNLEENISRRDQRHKLLFFNYINSDHRNFKD